MAGGKRKEPESSSGDQETSKKSKTSEPSKPPKPLRKPSSKTSANGVGMRNADNSFFDDGEAWIKVYYTLLARKAALNVEISIPPTTDILLLFNLYFQGFKEPVGKPSQNWDLDAWVLECVAVPTRIPKDLVGLETAVQRVCPELKTQIDMLCEQRPAYVDGDNAAAEVSSLFVTPEQITTVLGEVGQLDADGNPVTTALNNLLLPDATPADTDLWGDKAVARINARETRTPDDHPGRLDYKTRH